MFIAMYVLSYVGGGLLLRYAEGATYLAVVNVSYGDLVVHELLYQYLQRCIGEVCNMWDGHAIVVLYPCISVHACM